VRETLRLRVRGERRVDRRASQLNAGSTPDRDPTTTRQRGTDAGEHGRPERRGTS